MSELDGVWKVERTGGALPPLLGVTKRIEGTRGRTIFPGLPPLRFEVRGLSLHYKPPFKGLVDVLEPDGEDGFHGRATLGGRTFGHFAMKRRPPKLSRTGSETGGAVGATDAMRTSVEETGARTGPHEQQVSYRNGQISSI